jgi:hypothetical protein
METKLSNYRGAVTDYKNRLWTDRTYNRDNCDNHITIMPTMNHDTRPNQANHASTYNATQEATYSVFPSPNWPTLKRHLEYK